MGWLIPVDKAAEFEQAFISQKESENEEWDDRFCWAEWENEENPVLKFVFY